ncbi:sugar-binding protein [Cerasicoccus fimbriatus]|uniref:sugar-binding protein n=1 Tax=Cerasicoccus fimbriatus TaxID=3014554 RepID=UPI0022B31AE6|nr:sugar-binding protein [Cerasicoccus sp. TK19100]
METTPPSNDPARRKHLWRHSLWFFIALSLVIHFSGFVPRILEEIIPEKQEPQPTPEELAAEALAEEQAAQQALIQETRNMLRHELQVSFESIAADMEEIQLDELWEQVEMDIDIDLAELEDLMQQQDYDMEQFAEQYSDISADMFQTTADALKDMVRQELKQATLEQVQEHTIDKLAQNLDKRMENNVGKTEERRLTKAAQVDTRNRERQQIQEARKNKEPKPEFNEADKVANADQDAREAVKFVVEENIKQEIQEEFDQTLEERLAPESAERILMQANRYFQKFGMDEDEQLREELLADIAKTVQEQVPERMKDQASQLALKSAEEQLKLDEVEAKEREIDIPEKEQPTPAPTPVAQQPSPPEAADNADKSDAKQAAAPPPPPPRATTAEAEAEKESAEEQPEPEPTISPDPLVAEIRDRPREAREAQVEREVAAASHAAELGDMSEKMDKIEAKLKMMEKAQLMADFHESGRTEAGDMTALMTMMSQSGQQEGPEGQGNMMGAPGLNLPFSRPLPGGRSRGFNAEVFQKLLEMSRARNEPDAAYEDIEAQAERLVSKANSFPEKRDALLIDPRAKADAEEQPEPEEPRELQEPDFQPIKFGFATMVREKPVLDGQIGEDEWPLDRPQYNQNTLDGAKVQELPVEQAIPMWIQWDPSGLYFAAKVTDSTRQTPPGPGRIWQGDSVEIWIDTSTARGPLMKYYEAIQMFFAPFGTVEDPSVVAEFGHGHEMRGMPNSRGVFHQGGGPDGMQLAMQKTPAGYDVEIFIPHNGKVLKGPKFKAGKYIGFQTSFNYIETSRSISWVMRGHHTWERPDTWGDLLLLGSDAEIGFYEDEAAETELTILSPGEPVVIKVHDPDMNLDARYKDQIVANAIGSGGYEQLIVLGETEPNSGVFIGGINTNSAYAGLVDDSVPVEPGQTLTVIYIDQRRDYGESNKTMEITLPVAWPSLRFGQAN